VRELAGGARGDIGLNDKEGTVEWKGCDSGKCFSGARKTRVGWFSITGITLIFEIDSFTILTEDVSKSADRTGEALCGREISGTLVPTKSKNKGRTRAMKQKYLVFLNFKAILYL
jgi:hypothetical protein